MPAEHVFAAEKEEEEGEEEGQLRRLTPSAAAPRRCALWGNNLFLAKQSKRRNKLGRRGGRGEILNDTALLKAKAQAASSYAERGGCMQFVVLMSARLRLRVQALHSAIKNVTLLLILPIRTSAYTCTSELMPC